ncbi:uncharacterized protein LOC111616974 [Centruroides sculpturatus]|uniref:uncharacterized protein LOC111616972 n=1 Tax=Centruroides sculpturatus TaxID=218467 RepID=UPI000C6EBCFA|nr:uncharacterized protein LOC111616972 [Centruroides sculpturatus]XP_023214092.1 uncharacterized protein LOC111616974 [Centruroides sculpturatus]
MENQPVLDIGAGAGFPSLPLKIVFPKIRLTIYEANAKKVAFLNNVKGELNLDFKVVHTRAETSQDRESFAFILARAVADLKHLIQMSYHLGQPNCQFLFVKGAGYQQEINASQALVKKLKIKIQVYRAPEPALSYLITFRKALPTPVDFPPPWAKMHQA